MPTVKQVIEEVYDEVQDQSLTVERILRAMNVGAQLLALGHFEDLGVGEIFLPNLEKFTTIDIVNGVGDLSTVEVDSVVTPYCKALVSASMVGGGPTQIVSSLSQIEQYYPGLTATGAPQFVTVYAGELIAVPRNTSSLYIQYFAKAPVLDVSSSLDFLPDEFAVSLLRNFILMDIPSKYKNNLSFNPQERFVADITRLVSSAGVYSGKPKFVHNQVWSDYGYVQ
jgi:hypothetical protein